MAFSATDAALEGFRIARERPKAVLIWALASLALSVGSALLIVTMFGGLMTRMADMETSGDPQAAMAMMGQMGGFYLVMLPLGLLVMSVFTAAVYRAVLRPSDSAFGYLRLGADELRLAVVTFVLGLLSIVLSFAVIIVLSILSAIIGVGMIGAAGNGGGVGGMLSMIIMVIILYLIAGMAVLAFATKLSLAGPMTFAERRIRIFESWSATKGRFWSLFGCYLLAGILGIVVSLLGWIISFAVMSGFGGHASAAGGFAGMFEAMQPDFASLATYFSAAMIANLVISSIFSALTYAIFLAPAAVAYREIVGNGRTVSETFG